MARGSSNELLFCCEGARWRPARRPSARKRGMIAVPDMKQREESIARCRRKRGMTVSSSGHHRYIDIGVGVLGAQTQSRDICANGVGSCWWFVCASVRFCSTRAAKYRSRANHAQRPPANGGRSLKSETARNAVCYMTRGCPRNVAFPRQGPTQLEAPPR